LGFGYKFKAAGVVLKQGNQYKSGIIENSLQFYCSRQPSEAAFLSFILT